MPELPVLLPPATEDPDLVPEPAPVLLRPPLAEAPLLVPQTRSTHTMALGQSAVERHVVTHRPDPVQMRPVSQSALEAQGGPQYPRSQVKPSAHSAWASQGAGVGLRHAGAPSVDAANTHILHHKPPRPMEATTVKVEP